MSTHIVENRVLAANVEQVWAILRPLDFKWLSTVQGVKADGSDVGSVKTIQYKDGTVQKVKVLELSDLQRFITYDVFESNPAVSVMSAIHTLKLTRITHDNTTLLEWVSDYSHDASLSVLQDSVFKKKEGFQDLVQYLKNQKIWVQ